MNPPAASDDAPARARRWREIIPAARWLPSYEPQWFRSDLAAGVTLAAYVLPAALGDASLAGLPPQAGLYACLYGGLAFWPKPVMAEDLFSGGTANVELDGGTKNRKADRGSEH